VTVTDVTAAPSASPACRDDLPRVPDPELLDLTAPGAREALARFADAITTEALDHCSTARWTGPDPSRQLPGSRRRLFGPDGSPGEHAPVGRAADDVLRTFRERVAPMTFNASTRPRSATFTPPPLAMSVGGEVLGQWLQQGVDVWHAGPVGRVRRGGGVTRWLCDLVGYRRAHGAC
jgi:hypothetical protein